MATVPLTLIFQLITHLATLYFENVIYDYPAVVLTTICADLFANYCAAYLRKRRFIRYLQRLTDGSMDSSVPVKDRRGYMVGAWGFKFFESDHDYDVADHLSADMGLGKYNPDPGMQDSLLNPKNRAFITQHIQSPEELDRVFKKYFGMLQDYKVIDIKATLAEQMMVDSPRYYIFLLGLLAMQLGCTLSRKHRRWMKANWDNCLFMYERLDQAKRAAFEYDNGTPLKLDSKTLHEKGKTMGPNEHLNVPNNSKYVSIMRMYLDNEVAKDRGATTEKGVDISNAFTHDAAYIAALESVTKGKAKHSASKDNTQKNSASENIAPKDSVPQNSGPKDNVPATPTAAADKEIKATQWASNQAGWNRLEQHNAEAPETSTENVSAEEMAWLIAELIKKGNIG